MEILNKSCVAWSYAKKNINITHLIAFSLGVITICFLDALVFEKNITDLISSLSTFGTLCVAYAAYRKAPDWIQQRKNESAYNIAFKLIDNEIPRLSHSIKTYSHSLKRLRTVLNRVNDDIHDKLAIKTTHDLINLTQSNQKLLLTLSFDIKDSIEKLKRLGCKIKNKNIENLRHWCFELDKKTEVINEGLDFDLQLIFSENPSIKDNCIFEIIENIEKNIRFFNHALSNLEQANSDNNDFAAHFNFSNK
ncbi:hypothetical protein [Pectobacterium odoriferum]|uniref:hypothetical protein n=1 Tax=Pectobacterium odoriferum TaxID=78398 RepID=UPI000CD1C8CB|nr:hypothetical protein [Pectobacterium odoriferum]POE40255.1 hypothetical protein BV920_08845 [Pectobacterium odoriferum]